MKPHPRIRKTVKWGGLALTVLLVVGWVGSAWWSISAESSGGWLINVGAGHVFIAAPNGEPGYVPDTGAHVFWNDIPWTLWPSYWYVGPIQQCSIHVPVWVFALIAVAICITATRLDTLALHRAKFDRCPRCGYEHTGLAPGAACPECGSPAPAAHP